MITRVGQFYHHETYESYLREVLSEDKRPIGLFLAAGCPVAIRKKESGNPPLIPDVAGLTQLVIEQVGNTEGTLMRKILDNITPSLNTTPTVEDILSHLRLLQQIPNSHRIYDVDNHAIKKLEDDICALIEEKVSVTLPSNDTPYHKLVAWIGSIERKHPIEIFTTNYDLLLEQALEEANIPYFDGFVGSSKAFLDMQTIEENKLPERWVRVWKLHGSVNWHLDTDTHGVYRGKGEGACSLIHPSHLKYDQSRRMPYLIMIDRLKQFLRQPSAVMVTCGYSYRDQHINEVLSQGLQGNVGALLFGLLFSALEDYEDAQALASKRNNALMLAKDRAVIGKTKLEWQPTEHTSLEEKSGEELLSIFKLGDFRSLATFLEAISKSERRE